MAQGRPPNTDIRNMKQLVELPNRPSPTLKNPKSWSEDIHDFLAKCLTKDQHERPRCIDIISHPWVTRAQGAQVLAGIIRECFSIKAGITKS
jgi:mitogen-activated protein kinase kinase